MYPMLALLMPRCQGKPKGGSRSRPTKKRDASEQLGPVRNENSEFRRGLEGCEVETMQFNPTCMELVIQTNAPHLRNLFLSQVAGG